MNNTEKIFETHAHYDDKQFDGDREEVLTSMAQAGVDTIVNIGADLKGSAASVELAAAYPFIYAAVGVHPDRVGELNPQSFETLKQLSDNKKVVAIGEIGLDYHWDTHPREMQKEWFLKQLELARQKQLPVVIHSREATNDTLDIIKEHGRDLKGVIHCFSGSVEVAREYVKLGYYIGVGGVVTFKNGRMLKEVVLDTPLSHLVIETDCPYLSPEPNRGKRNDSMNLEYIAKEIASIKAISYQEVLEATHKNGRELYGI